MRLVSFIGIDCPQDRVGDNFSLLCSLVHAENLWLGDLVRFGEGVDHQAFLELKISGISK